MRGWLLYFCLQLFVLNPVVIGFQVMADLRTLHARDAVLSSAGAMIGLDAAARLGLVALGLVGGTLLVIRHRVALAFIRGYLILFAVTYFLLVGVPYLFDFSSEVRTRIVAMYLYRAVWTVPATTFWLLYFKHSKRVKATYDQAPAGKAQP